MESHEKQHLGPHFFAQKPSCNKPNQVKNIMDPTIPKVKPFLQGANSGSAGSVPGDTGRAKRQKVAKKEAYKVSNNRLSPRRETRSQRAAGTGWEGAGDCAVGSPEPAAVLSQVYDSSDNDTMKGANYDGIANMVATVDDGLNYDDSRDYDDDSLDKEEATEKGPGARADGMTTAGPKADMETTQINATTGKAKADKATNVGVEKEGDVDEGVHGLRHGMAALEAAMAVPGSTAACFAE
jgi:hypothetical protein